MGLNARDAILGRVREALRDVPAGEAIEPPAYEPPPPAGGNAVARFAERVSDYRATVREAGALAETIVQVCAQHEARRLGVPAGLLEGWRPEGIELVEDHGLSARDLDALDGALTGCALAIAETGTIVLDGGERSGRRALTLVPDLHLCLVERSQVVATVPDAIRALDGALTGCALAIAETGTIVLDGGERSGRRALTLVPDLHLCLVERSQVVATVPDAIRALDGARGPFTFVSGPSATSDIELDRVEGVHGPRRLEVLLV